MQQPMQLKLFRGASKLAARIINWLDSFNEAFADNFPVEYDKVLGAILEDPGRDAVYERNGKRGVAFMRQRFFVFHSMQFVVRYKYMPSDKTVKVVGVWYSKWNRKKLYPRDTYIVSLPVKDNGV